MSQEQDNATRQLRAVYGTELASMGRKLEKHYKEVLTKGVRINKKYVEERLDPELREILLDLWAFPDKVRTECQRTTADIDKLQNHLSNATVAQSALSDALMHARSFLLLRETQPDNKKATDEEQKSLIDCSQALYKAATILLSRP